MATIDSSIGQVQKFTDMVQGNTAAFKQAERASKALSSSVEEAFDLSAALSQSEMGAEPIQKAVKEAEALQKGLAKVSMGDFNSEVEESCRLLEQLSQVSFEDAYNVEIPKGFSEEDKTDAKKIADMETQAAERASPPKVSHEPELSSAVEETGAAAGDDSEAAQDQFEKYQENFDKINGLLGNSAPSEFFDNITGHMQDAVQNSTMLSDVMNGTLMAIMGTEGAQNIFGGLLSDMAGLTTATDMFNTAFNGIFPYIEPVIMGIQAALALYQGYLKMTEIATKLLGKESAITNAIMAACPIIFIITLIVGLIMAILAIVATFEPVRTGIANFMRSVGSIFSAGVGFVIDLFTGMANTVIGIINKILGWVNDLINAVGDILGIESQVSMELKEIDSSAFKDKLQMNIEGVVDMAATGVEEFSTENLQEKFNFGAIEEQSQQQADAMAAQEEHMAMQKQHYSTQEDHFATQEGYMSTTSSALTAEDDLSGEVAISPDDADLMRQIAEAKSIQNFVTLAPTVDVTTGDIKEEADVDKLVDRITAVLVEDVTISAEGAYA